MRKFILTPLIAILLSFGLTFNLTAQDLMITGVADGPLSGGTPKAIELYVINDVSDLSEYGIAIAANGASSPGSPAFDLPADPATAGEYYYLAGTEQDFIDFFGFSPDFTSGSVSFNGDDAIELYQNGSVVDVFGEVGVDGTDEAWDYLDGWGYRVDDTSPAATFDANDWTFSGTNELEGGTTNADCNQPFPIGTFSMGGGCSPITTFPWTEDFDGDWTSWCWTVIDNDSDGTTWTQDDTYITPHSGDWTAHGMGNADDYLITPEIAVNSANFLIEWYDVVESASYNNTYDVLVSTTDTDPASFTDNLGTFDCTNTDWTKHSLDLSAYDGQNIYIAFHQTYSGASNWGFGIDDVTIREANTETDILTYSFPEETGAATIDDVNHTVDVEVAWDADITALTADFTLSDGATAEIGGVEQESGVTENDFSSPLTYTIIAEDGTTTQDWTVTVTIGDPPLGVNCDNPFPISLPTDLTYEDFSQTNCGLGNTYDDTDMDSYDNGEDAIYEITVTSDVIVDITLDPYSTSYAGIGIFEGCPDDNVLIADEGSSSSAPRVLEGVILTAGTTYYIMVDIWPSPDCITEYDLTIEEACPAPANVDATDLTSTSALITWDAGGIETDWNLKVDTVSIDPATETGDIFDGAVSTTPEHALSGLTAETDYYVYVQADCDSDWTAEYVFTTLSDCPQPTDVLASYIGSDNVELDWDAYGETEWVVKVATSPISPDTEDGDIVAAETTTDKPYTLSGLSPNTDYYFYVQSSCGSDWTTEFMFTTECETISTFPWTEDFENGGDIPECWINAIDDGGGEWEFTSSSTHGPDADHTSGSGYFAMLDDYNTYTSENPVNLLTPVADITGGDYQLTYWFWIGADADDNPIHIDISTDGGNNWTEDVYVHDLSTTETWTENTIMLDVYSSAELVIRFRGISNYGFGTTNSGIDDVAIEEVPACLPPSDLAIDSYTTTEADVSWTEAGSATSWNVVYGAPGFDPETEGTVEVADAIPYTISGLDAGTHYDVYVQADCGGGELSDFTGPVSFMTDCDAVTTFPWTEPFEDAWSGTPESPECWEAVNGISGSYWEQSDSEFYNGDYAARTYQGTSSGYKADEWLITQAVDLDALSNPILDFYGLSSQTPEGVNADMRIMILDAPYSDTTDLHANATEIDVVSFTEDWENYSIDLSTYSGIKYIAFNYYVTEADNASFNWMYIDDVSVRELNTETDILTYSFPEQTTAATIDDVNHTIDVEVGNGTDLTSLVADFTLSTGAIAEVAGVEQESGTTANDFSSPVTYTVTAEDGTTTQDWTVTVTEAPVNTETDILTYSFPEETGAATIDDVNHTVDVEIAWDADITALTADFTLSYGATAEVDGVEQESGVTENDFSSPLTYTIIAEDSITTQDWTVTVTIGDAPMGANCDNPFQISLPTDLTYEDLSQTNCGLGNAYEDTDMGNYDNGEDAVYEITVTSDVVVDITLDPYSTTWTGIGIFEGCPDDNVLIADEGTSSTDPRVLEGVILTAGTTYYIMVDTYASPDCITEYDLTIEEACPTPANVDATDLTSTTANIIWDAGGIETDWNLKVDTVSIDPATETGDIFDGAVSTTPEHALSGLTAETDYYVYVQADCDSDWTAEYMFTTPSSCPVITGLTTTDVGIDYAILDWDALGTSEWNIKISDVSIDPETEAGNIEDVTATTDKPYTTAATLTSNTTYYYYVQPTCGADWSAEAMFTTECDIFTAPFTEDFENGGDIPDCWSQGADNVEVWDFTDDPSGTHIGDGGTTTGSTSSGGYMAWVDDSTPHELGTELLSPMIDVSSLTVPQLSFFLISNNEGDSNVDFSVDVWDGAAWNDDVFFSNSNTAAGGWEQIIVSLDGLTITGPIQIRFVVDENNGDDYDDDIAIDDVTIDEAPTCPAVTDLAIDSYTTTEADVIWTENGSATSWNVVYGAPGFDPETEGTVEVADAIPYTISGLDASTQYDVYVQADCGGDDLSDFTGPVSFMTDCDAVTTFPWTETFDSGVAPDCWSIEGGSNWISSDSDEAGGTAPEAKFNWDPSTTANQKLISPVFNTTGYSELTLEFKHLLDDFSEGGYTIGIATTSDGGTTWNDVWTISPTDDLGPETLSILIDNADMGSSDFQFAFYFDGDSFDINHWNIDDVILRENNTDLALIEPSSGIDCELTDSEVIPVEFENVGNSTIASGEIVNFTVTSEGTPMIDEDITLSDDLLPGESWSGTTTGTVDLSAIGTYTWTAAITYATDINADNDTIEGYIVNFGQEIQFPDAVNDTIFVTEFPYTIQPDVVYTPDSAGLSPEYLWGGGETLSMLQVDDEGWYDLTVTTDGCSVEDSVFIRHDVGIDDFSTTSLAIYPNPNDGQFTVDMTLNERQDVILTVISSHGQVVRELKLDDVDKINKTINISDMAEGLYNLQISAGDKQFNRKIIVR